MGSKNNKRYYYGQIIKKYYDHDELFFEVTIEGVGAKIVQLNRDMRKKSSTFKVGDKVKLNRCGNATCDTYKIAGFAITLTSKGKKPKRKKTKTTKRFRRRA